MEHQTASRICICEKASHSVVESCWHSRSEEQNLQPEWSG